MKIVKKYKVGWLKGYTIRQSKYGWFSVYSANGVCQSGGKIKSMKDAVSFVNHARRFRTLNSRLGVVEYNSILDVLNK